MYFFVFFNIYLLHFATKTMANKLQALESTAGGGSRWDLIG